MDAPTARRWIDLVGNAREAVGTFTNAAAPSHGNLIDLARHALYLARIDLFFRAKYVDEKVGTADPSDMDDCIRLLEAGPWDELISGGPVLLNPTFGEPSRRVGGADADMICGNRVIDFKVMKQVAPREILRQLVGHLILAREARCAAPSFPEITELVTYYARRRHVDVIQASRFTDHPRFEEACGWFWARADRLFGGTTGSRVDRLEL